MLAPEPSAPAVQREERVVGPVLGGVEDPPLQALVEPGVALDPLLRQGVELARGDQAGDAADPVVLGEHGRGSRSSQRGSTTTSSSVKATSGVVTRASPALWARASPARSSRT